VDEGVIQMNLGPGSAPPDPPNSPPTITLNADTTAIVGKPLKLSASTTDDGIPKPRRRAPSVNASQASTPMPLPREPRRSPAPH